MIITYNHLIEQLDFSKYFERPISNYDQSEFEYMLTYKNQINY